MTRTQQQHNSARPAGRQAAAHGQSVLPEQLIKLLQHFMASTPQVHEVGHCVDAP